MRLVRVGEGAAELLAGHATGRVSAVFRRAAYLSLPRGLFALVDPAAEPGPLHAHVTVLPPLAVGDPVRVDGGVLHVAGVSLPRCPEVWRPPPLTEPARRGESAGPGSPAGPAGAPYRMLAAAAMLRRVLDHEPDLDLAGGVGPAGEESLSTTLRQGGLGAAVAVLAGRGTGLTPAGDDVLAGLLVVARMTAGPEQEGRLVALARRAPTHDISRGFLEWAGRGRSIAALHDLIGACADGDAWAAGAARARLARVGRTSGLDLAYGALVGAANCATAPWPGAEPGDPRADRRRERMVPSQVTT